MWTSLVWRLIVIDGGDMPHVSSLIFLVTLLHCFRHLEQKTNRLIPFSHNIVYPPRNSINVILTCPQPLGAFPIAMQALMCVYFLYHATDFDTFRMSYLIISIITVWISMCTPSKRHVTLHFVSPAMKVTCSSG